MRCDGALAAVFLLYGRELEMSLRAMGVWCDGAIAVVFLCTGAR